VAYFSIGGIQLAVSSGNNLEQIILEIQLSKRKFPWLDMLVLGELSCLGPGMDACNPTYNELVTRFCHLAKELKIWLLPGSFYEQVDGKTYNTAPVINPAGDVIARYQKMFPFLPYESGVHPGSEFVVFEIPQVGKFGVSICYDMWFPETTRTLVCMGAEVILHPTMTNTLDRDVEISIARANAATNQCYFFDINVTGDLGAGRSVVLGPGGEVIHQAGRSSELIPVEINLEYVRRVRERGWQGLGQVLKSFRDSEVKFPIYADFEQRQKLLSHLGDLKTPTPGV